MHLIISDLHLDAGRPRITELFRRFLAERAVRSDGLFILGDLFEAWIGDDDDDPHHRAIIDALARFSDSGTPGYVMHGNRDFLLGESFCARTGLTLLDDPHVTELAGRRVVLSHGDLLCTDDQQYQEVRQMLRSDAWRRDFLRRPLDERRQFAVQARAESQQYIAGAEEALMDVNQGAVEDLMRTHDVDLLIHGHTHRPAIHDFELDHRPVRRIVLGDWYEQGSVLGERHGEYRLRSMPVEAEVAR